MIEYGRRRKDLPAPPAVVWADLCEPRLTGTRAWLSLLSDEQPPTILECEEPTRVVWSSLWRRRPDDRIEFAIGPNGTGCWLEFAVFAPDELPTTSLTGHIRQRLNELLFGELRYTYGQ